MPRVARPVPSELEQQFKHLETLFKDVMQHVCEMHVRRILQKPSRKKLSVPKQKVGK